ncbi:hypothetical protein [Paenibacillus harenae]|uniref:hypothetical protein n=1 Tax=Paenibacillus harenae TaxID=306543 RepID=UPI00278FFC10|nr:hypothetical protein [Paenibacillus harenae]MDQ0060263.1 hypothetical protein [Paenibacillus harenae]
MATKKRMGYGSFSIVLLLLGFSLNWHFDHGFIVSHALFQIIGLDTYSNGTNGFHYPFLASMPFWLAAVLVSKKYANDFGAAVSNRIGELMLALSVFVTTVFLILPF